MIFGCHILSQPHPAPYGTKVFFRALDDEKDWRNISVTEPIAFLFSVIKILTWRTEDREKFSTRAPRLFKMLEDACGKEKALEAFATLAALDDYSHNFSHAVVREITERFATIDALPESLHSYLRLGYLHLLIRFDCLQPRHLRFITEEVVEGWAKVMPHHGDYTAKSRVHAMLASPAFAESIQSFPLIRNIARTLNGACAFYADANPEYLKILLEKNGAVNPTTEIPVGAREITAVGWVIEGRFIFPSEDIAKQQARNVLVIGHAMQTTALLGWKDLRVVRLEAQVILYRKLNMIIPSPNDLIAKLTGAVEVRL